MDGTLDVAAGGGPLSPLLLLLIVSSIQILDLFLGKLKKDLDFPSVLSRHKAQGKAIHTPNAGGTRPSTFAQAAKLRRKAAAKEKELMKKQEEQAEETRSSYDMYARAFIVLKVFLYAGVCWRFWSIPVAVVPQHLLQPFGRVFPLRVKGSATGLVTVGIIPWLVVTSQVSKFACQRLSQIILSK